ncbi:hypothetical protein OESDEN_10449 [Oesophagostomum dentatum]|uniref:SCP domain-containing protein n=1 Tax=Oesophagostomum dentatum TaxID=61180 RepID=A0A0B1T1R9_OESDE|nr:hypothetical protein OESDEN_10449 [Oesophagostomum dentatum]
MDTHLLLGFLVISLLPFLCKGAPYCTGGETEKTDVEQFLETLNKARSSIASGTQKHGPDGKTLPHAKNMQKLSWNCELEKKAVGLKRSCPDNAPDAPSGNALLYSRYSF